MAIGDYSKAVKSGALASSRATHNLPSRSSSEQRRTTRVINEGASQISQGNNSFQQNRYPSQVSYEPKDYTKQSNQEAQRNKNDNYWKARSFASEADNRKRHADSLKREHEKELLQMQIKSQNPTGKIISSSFTKQTGIPTDLKLAQELAKNQRVQTSLEGSIANRIAQDEWNRRNQAEIQARAYSAQQAQADRALAAHQAASEQRNRLATVKLENEGRLGAAKIAAQGNLYSSWFQAFNPVGNPQSYKYW